MVVEKEFVASSIVVVVVDVVVAWRRGGKASKLEEVVDCRHTQWTRPRRERRSACWETKKEKKLIRDASSRHPPCKNSSRDQIHQSLHI